MEHKQTAILIVAGGKGERMGADIPKQFLKVNGLEIIQHTLMAFRQSSVADKYIIVCHKDYTEHLNSLMMISGIDVPYVITAGGDTRQQSVLNGLKHCSDFDYVMVHDAVRCCINPIDIVRLRNELAHCEACALGVKVTDTIKKSDCDNNIIGTVNRENLWHIQTPQAFSLSLLIKSHMYALNNGYSATDDCAVVENYGAKVKIVEGDYNNIKITTKTDLIFASAILKGRE